MRGHVYNRQFRAPVVGIFEIDGSAVTTDYAQDGLLCGLHIADVKKGSGADSNLVTLRLKRPLGTIPQVKFQPITLDCECRLEETPTDTLIKVRTLELDGVTKEDDADFVIFLFASEHGEFIEGWHR